MKLLEGILDFHVILCTVNSNFCVVSFSPSDFVINILNEFFRCDYSFSGDLSSALIFNSFLAQKLVNSHTEGEKLEGTPEVIRATKPACP